MQSTNEESHGVWHDQVNFDESGGRQKLKGKLFEIVNMQEAKFS